MPNAATILASGMRLLLAWAIFCLPFGKVNLGYFWLINTCRNGESTVATAPIDDIRGTHRDEDEFFPVRPGAAANYSKLAVAARFQPSSFSCQLLQKHREHAFDLGDLGIELLEVSGLDQLQVSAQEEMIFKLAG